MNNALAYLGGFLAVVLAALFGVPAMIDWNGYRGVFEEEASKALGRDVRVGGGVNLRLLPTPYVQFERVRLADVSGNTGEPFIRVENFTMRLSGPALLRGVLEATEIALNKPVLTLALDGAGGGNWSSISFSPRSLPFVPNDVTLKSVKLIDGAVSVYAPDATIVTKIQGINGELAADAIRGPYRFKGLATWSGLERDVRFATTEMSDDGGFRMKAVSRTPSTGATFTIDASVDDFTGTPRLSGALIGQFAVPGASASVNDGKRSAIPTMDLKSTVNADAGGAKLTDLSLSLIDAAEPQLISGAASAYWIGTPRLDLELASKWLDFDRLAGAGSDSAPFLKIKQLALGVIGAVAGEGAASAKIDVDQVKLGGETAGGLKIDAERRGGTVRLKELRAGLPGGSRLFLSGDIKSADSGALAFAGEGFVSGSSLGRLKAWAEKSGASIDIGPDGPFSAEGKVRVSGGAFELTEAAAEIGGRAMTGEVKIIDDGRHRAEITVECAELERSDLFPATTKALEAAIRRALGVAGAGAPAQSAHGDNMDVSLRVLAGQLKRGGEIYRDVDATVALEKGDIRVPSAKFTTSAGLAVTIEGRIDDKNGAPAGSIAFGATGASPPAMRDIARVFGIEALIAPERLEKFKTASLAGIVKLGARAPHSADVSVDGVIAGSRISLQGSSDIGLADWRRHPAQVRIAMSAPSVGDLAASIGGKKPIGVAEAQARPAQLALTIAGAVETGAASRLDITSDGLALGYDGAITWPEGRALNLAGNLQVAARELGDVLAIAGVAPGAGSASAPIKGDIAIERRDEAWTLKTDALAVGSSALKGAIKLASAATGPAAISGDLSVDHVDAAGLLALVVDASAKPLSAPPPAAEGAPVEASDDAEPNWPVGRFNFAALDDIAGDIGLSFDRLTIGDGLQVASGRMNIVLAPNALGLTKITGAAAGGEAQGDVTLRSTASGVAADAKILLAKADLSKLGASASGAAGLDLKLAGQAQSPAALIASLVGDGNLTLEAARVAGANQKSVRNVADAVLAGKIAKEPEPISAALKDAVGAAIADFGSRTVNLKVVNGVASITPILLDDDAGETMVTASLDLSSFDVVSLFKVVAIPSPVQGAPFDPGASVVAQASKGPLPAASVTLSGRLAELASAQPVIEAASLQRELAVRQLERSLEDLERLRRGDDDRVRFERERRRLIEEQKARAAAEARAKRDAERAPPAGPESANPPAAQQPPADPPQSQNAPADGDEKIVEIGQPTPQPQPPAEAAPPTGETGAATAAAPETSPVPRPRPPKQAAPRRSYTDEFSRPLGGFP